MTFHVKVDDMTQRFLYDWVDHLMNRLQGILSNTIFWRG